MVGRFSCFLLSFVCFINTLERLERSASFVHLPIKKFPGPGLCIPEFQRARVISPLMIFFTYPSQVTLIMGSKCVLDRLFGLDTKSVLVDKKIGQTENYQDTEWHANTHTNVNTPI